MSKIALTFLIAVLSLPQSASATRYRFTPLAVSGVVGPPSLNDNGEVAYVAETEGQRGVYKMNGDEVTTIALAGVGPVGSAIQNFAEINNQGVVGFYSADNVQGNGGALFTGDGTTLTTIWDNKQGHPVSIAGAYSLNNNGDMAFHASFAGHAGYENGIVVGNGGPLRILAGGPDRVVNVASAGSNHFVLNDNGVAAFSACLVTLGCNYPTWEGSGLFLSDGTGLQTVFMGLLDPPDAASLLAHYTLAMNNGGEVIFSAVSGRPHLAGVYIKSPSGPLTLLAGPSGADGVDINDNGDYAFLAQGGSVSGIPFIPGAIYTGPDPIADRVVIPSDFGGGSILFFREGLNNRGQLAFTVCLGSCLMVVATPIVPGDANEDGQVDRLDVAILTQHFGTTTGATFNDGDLGL